jgi:GGDEF domain-containing protein
MGISLYPLNDSCEPAQLLELADQAMYAAKQNGSNCYIIADAGLSTQ